MNKNENPGVTLALRIVLVLVVALIIAMFFVVKRHNEMKKNDKGVPAAERSVPVKVIAVKSTAIRDEISVPGRIEPFAHANIAAEIGGKVVEVAAGKGDKVEAGQLLLKLDSRLAEDAMKQAEIQKSDIEREYQRLSQLKETGAVSASDFDSITKARELAAIAFHQAQVMFSHCEVRSPIHGLVNNRTIELGEYVNQGQPVFEVVNIDEVKVNFAIAERDILSVSQDKEMSFTVESIPGRTFKGSITFVASAASRESNSFQAELKAENPEKILKPGMMARLSLLKNSGRRGFLVPLVAIIPHKGDNTGYVVENGKSARRVFRIDSIIGSEAVVLSGIAEGDQLVVDGGRALVDGVAVKVIDDQAGAAAGGSEKSSEMPAGEDKKAE